jgi:thiamine-phosphate pyrophosphorylase
MAILDDSHGSAIEIIEKAAGLVSGGIRVFQLRAKKLADRDFLDLALRLKDVIPGRGLFINDRCDIAAMSGAGGIHLGIDDVPPAAARRLLGSGVAIGLSAGTRGELARALAARPDYVSLGPAFQTRTKIDAGMALGRAGFARLARLARCRGARVVLAVGGVTADNVGGLLSSGADAVAVAGVWWRSADPARAAGELVAAVALARDTEGKKRGLVRTGSIKNRRREKA